MDAGNRPSTFRKLIPYVPVLVIAAVITVFAISHTPSKNHSVATKTPAKCVSSAKVKCDSLSHAVARLNAMPAGTAASHSHSTSTTTTTTTPNTTQVATPTTLVNTGPSTNETIALISGVVVLGTAGYQYYQVRRI